ncbi:MAG: NADH:ubiquinone reductase (Na(+)-transporting) subunit C [Bacteroidales bacterium]|nr:NADH:ubiquinone reductase (Na(+)-transporting) subunit C [Bacteroidales bacterium]
MKSFSNTYIFVFSTVMVILVAAILSSAAMLLQPLQQKNFEIEQKRNILASITIESSATDAESLYEKYIIESYVVDSKGEIKDGVDAFKVNMIDEVRKPDEEKSLPIFVGLLANEKKEYVIPVRGAGLWGPIYGYVALNDDFNTIFGTNFGHDGETPGLGSQITTPWFQDRFKGREIFSGDGVFISIDIVKGKSDPSSMSQVDGITGSTLTTNGLEDMLKDCLKPYEAYFKNQMN